MDEPNITMEEYIRLEEEKACRRGKVFYWETAKYDFKNEFLAIVYNDALTSKSDYPKLKYPLKKPPQHIDEFDLKYKTSLYECDEEEQNVLYFNDVFPFNVIYPDDSKLDKDSDDDKIDIKQSLEDMFVKPLPDLINTDVGAYAPHSLYGIFIKRIQRIRYRTSEINMAANENGDDELPLAGGGLPVPDLRTMEELFQPTLNGQGGPIAPIAIQATNFGLKNDMIQQV
ncbi:hypothetical protein Tco_1074370 [Tanacetum coccineum]